MTEQKYLQYFKALEGITYSEWGKLKHLIDEHFRAEISKQTKNLPLAENELLQREIKSIP